MIYNNITTNIIIICAGESSRWGNYLGSNKHLIKIGGERLIDRSCRLLKKYIPNCTITTIALSDIYANGYSSIYIPKLNEVNYDLDKFLSSRALWSPANRNIVFYGDIYPTQNFIKILSISIKRDWLMFGRYNNSYLTGKGGECFAFSFYGEHFGLFDNAMQSLINSDAGYKKESPGGWFLYRKLEGFKSTKHLIGEHLIEINDLTDDFDYPSDFDKWYPIYKKLSNKSKGYL